MTHKEFSELKHLEDITIRTGKKLPALKDANGEDILDEKGNPYSRLNQLRDKKEQSQKQSQSIVDAYHKRQQDYQQFMYTMNYLLKGGAI